MEAEDVLNLYEWAPGTCFQCARTDVDTTVVAVLRPVSSPEQVVRACRNCLLVMEEERRVAAARRGVPYEPGHAGEACGSSQQGTSEPG